MAELRSSGGSRLAAGHAARGSPSGSRFAAPRGSERWGSRGRGPARRDRDAEASRRTWFRDGSPPEKLLAAVREVLPRNVDEPRTNKSVAAALDVRPRQAFSWLKRLMPDGAIEQLSEPSRYRADGALRAPLFHLRTGEGPVDRTKNRYWPAWTSPERRPTSARCWTSEQSGV